MTMNYAAALIERGGRRDDRPPAGRLAKYVQGFT